MKVKHIFINSVDRDGVKMEWFYLSGTIPPMLKEHLTGLALETFNPLIFKGYADQVQRVIDAAP